MRAEHVRRDRGREVVTILVLVRPTRRHSAALSGQPTQEMEGEEVRDGPVLNVHEPLCVRVTEVTVVRQAQVDLGLVQGVLDLVGVDASGETGDDLLDLELVRGVQDVVVDEDVVPEEVELHTRAD